MCKCLLLHQTLVPDQLYHLLCAVTCYERCVLHNFICTLSRNAKTTASICHQVLHRHGVTGLKTHRLNHAKIESARVPPWDEFKLIEESWSGMRHALDEAANTVERSENASYTYSLIQIKRAVCYQAFPYLTQCYILCTGFDSRLQNKAQNPACRTCRWKRSLTKSQTSQMHLARGMHIKTFYECTLRLP